MTESTPRSPGTVLITGGASGLGAATARAVLAAGGTPLIIDRDKPDDTELAWEYADLADSGDAASAVAALVRRAGGRLDGVVTAAGTDACGTLAELDTEVWERVVKVNLLGSAAVVRAALPALRAARGRVVTVASTLGLRALSDATAYCASKFGVVGFTRALAAETAGEIGVTLLIPGGMQTAFFDDRPEQYRPGPDAKLNDPANVADSILYAMTRPEGSELRELVVCASTETSWP
ncbi:SDR family oxidoreductase [Nocardia sp. NPDC057353]|uniref:SDR family oxidoreductase n=1 Tax=Nocardia sp. NPDC057353 TaxID=3346104 RepID=UPI0036352DF6